MRHRSTRMTLQWVKGHDGIQGNEGSNALAKQGMNKDHPDPMNLEILDECYNPGPSNFSFNLTLVIPVPAPAPVAAPTPAPVAALAPTPVVRSPSPIQVDPADVPLPTPSTPSTHTPDYPMHPPSPPTFCAPTPGPSRYHQLPIVDHPLSPRMQSILKSLQKEHISERGRERPRHSTSTSDVQDLCHALADMFGLPLLPIPQPAPD
jgi:hypothetical protein